MQAKSALNNIPQNFYYTTEKLNPYVNVLVWYNLHENSVLIGEKYLEVLLGRNTVEEKDERPERKKHIIF